MINTQPLWLRIGLLIVVLRILLFGVSASADLFFEYAPTFPYADAVLASTQLPRWLYSWANFDGVHYITIVEKGYFGTGLIQAFFPLYPVLIKALSLGIASTIPIGLAVSLLSLGGYLLLLTHITQRTKITPWLVLCLALSFPTSFYLQALYTESLFCLLVTATFYYAGEKKWWHAAFFASLGSATRVVGIALAVALLIEVVQDHQQKTVQKTLQHLISKGKQQLAAVAVSCIGLLSYMMYLWYVFGDPWYFRTAQAEFGTGRSNQLVLLPQVIFRTLRSIWITASQSQWLAFSSYSFDLFATVLALVIVCWGYYRYRSSWFRLSWLVFSLLIIVIPTLTGTLSSMPRYILPVFPLWLTVVSTLENKKVTLYAVCTVLSILQILCVLLFTQGYWIA